MKFNKLKGWYGQLSDELLSEKLMLIEFRSERKALRKFDEQLHWTWHPEYVKYRRRKDYKKHKASYIKRASEAYSKNAKLKRQYGREHYRKNATVYKMRAIQRTEKAPRKPKDKDCLLFYKFCELLNKLHRSAKFHVDHIYPISKGGRTEKTNLQIATAEFNLWKRAKVGVTAKDYFGQAAAKP